MRLVHAAPPSALRKSEPTFGIHDSSGEHYLNRNSCQRELKQGLASGANPSALMAVGRTAAPLQDTPPDTGRDPDVPIELWQLPARVALRGNELGLSQKRLAALTGVQQPKISKLLSYKGLHTLDARFVILLARALQMTTDELLTGARPRIVYDTHLLPEQQERPSLPAADASRPR